MQPEDIQKLRSLTTFESLVDYLRDELDWPVDADDVDELTFDYEPEELGLNPKHKVKIESIKQLRPLADDQPWGIFYIQFESKRLPVGVLRRILKALVPKSRKRDPNRPVWQMSDLMFISSQGDPDKRSISFAHFRQRPGKLPELRTFSWDSDESHFYYIKNLNLAALRWPDDATDTEAWRQRWSQAFRVPHRYVPRTAKSLAQEMAKLARTIRDTVLDIYEVEHVGGPLHQLHLSFRMTLINDLTPGDFADMYAQTVTYGLFSARATHSGEFAIEDVAAMIPNTNPFLRELLEQLTTQGTVDLDELGVNQLAALLKAVDMEAILQDFGRQKRGEDPVIHFYETFLGAYDPEKKAHRGVFYTPDPVVSFIVRSVDHILRTEFDCPDGLADTSTMMWQGRGDSESRPVPKVQILDPATGTGTFLQYVIQVIWDTFYQKTKKIGVTKRKEKWNQYVSEHLLPRLYGFELMMAPYTIAHMKLGLKLKETGYQFGSDERLRVYLTNALQPAHEVPRTETPALAHEVEQANEVKNNAPIMVVIGNPPYAGHSSNVSRNSKGELNFIGNLLQDYYKVDGKPLGEKNPKWLQDDYVKFIRYAQEQIKQTGQGVVAMITNHGYLDNPTFRGMRQQLMQTFDEIYVIDLHGNTKKKETTPDGSKDENVFDIQQGVAICLMVKKHDQSKSAQMSHFDLYGLRDFKYQWLMTYHRDISSIKWQTIEPRKPFYLFSQVDFDLQGEYQRGVKITDLMPLNSVGIITGRDKLTVHFKESELWETIQAFTSRKPEEARKIFNLGKDSQDWKIYDAQQDLKSYGLRKDKISPILYRVFDIRHTFYTGKSGGFMVRPRPNIMERVIGNENICLITVRQQSIDTQWALVGVTRNIIEACVISNKTSEINYLFPLWKRNSIDDRHSLDLFADLDEGQPNFARRFYEPLREALSATPEDVFHYIYAILHSPSYRVRYDEFLKIDFPRIPLTRNAELFRLLCGLGADLVALHLMEDDYEAASWVQEGKASPLQTPITTFVEGVNGLTMGKFGRSKVYQDGRVYLDTSLGKDSSYFDGIPEDIWNFHIGCYQVLYKWLYDRSSSSRNNKVGRTLTPEDIEHYHKIVLVLKETIRLMDEIDLVIEEHGGWPIE